MLTLAINLSISNLQIPMTFKICNSFVVEWFKSSFYSMMIDGTNCYRNVCEMTVLAIVFLLNLNSKTHLNEQQILSKSRFANYAAPTNFTDVKIKTASNI